MLYHLYVVLLPLFSILFFPVIVICVKNKEKAAEIKDQEETSGFREPNICEVCKYLASELCSRLEETGKWGGFVEIGHGLDTKQRKRKEYKKSELRLIEALHDPHVCDKILQYNVHAERRNSLRYAKGRSQTMETLHGLVNKGVNVELGIPYEMWDQPSAEVTTMQSNCFSIVEQWEDDIEEWYMGNQKQSIVDYLCRDRILLGKDSSCLYEVFVPKVEENDFQESKEGADETGGHSLKGSNAVDLVKGDLQETVSSSVGHTRTDEL